MELSAVLEIDKVGHRKRILASVSGGEHITPGPRLEDINADLNMLVSRFVFITVVPQTTANEGRGIVFVKNYVRV